MDDIGEVGSKHSLVALLEANGFVVRFDSDAIESLPKGAAVEASPTFFNVGRAIKERGRPHEYKNRGLVPIDPHALVALNIADPSLSDRMHTTQWRDGDNRTCYMQIWKQNGVKRVYISKCEPNFEWCSGTSFVGVPA